MIGSVSFPLAREAQLVRLPGDVDGYNQFPDDRDVMLSSIMKNMNELNDQVVKSAFEGTFQGCTNYVGSLTNQGVHLLHTITWTAWSRRL